MFTPNLAVAALRTMRDKFGDRVYGRYGFVDAFNPNTSWVDTDVIGINVGIILLSAENARTGAVWRWFMKNPEIPRAMQRIGLLRYKPRHSVVGAALRGRPPLPLVQYRKQSPPPTTGGHRVPPLQIVKHESP